MKIENVMERVYERRRLNRAWQQVQKNAGAAGVDGMSVSAFEKRSDELMELIHQKLKAGTYRFKPARRVLIPKPGTDKKRKLGIPVVMDRVVSQSLHQVLEELYDPDFTRSNFGFRRGKSQQQAFGHFRQNVKDGYSWCAAIDLQSFFDEIPHGLILKLIRRKIRDERVVTLIARALKAGVLVDGILEKSTKGCPQGSPVSPILSNIVLNELDQELEKRGHRYSRWADDFVILVRSERAAHRVMKGITSFLEQELNLPVNREKSQVAPADSVEFLSFQIYRDKIKVGDKARTRFKERLRRLTPRNNPWSMHHIITELNEYLSGWISYYRIQELKCFLKTQDGYIRRRLRSMQLKKWKTPKKFKRMMIKAGIPVWIAKKTHVKMNRWSQSIRRPVQRVLNLKWFRKQGLIFLDDYTQRNLELRFAH